MIPKKIWILWIQGLNQAPFLVKKCIESWIKKNPTWEVIILSKDNLSNYIDLDLSQEKFSKLLVTSQSDLIRLQLLADYGGVWADATTLCMVPLDDWIHDYCSTGFFAFERPPGRDRMISVWFMAAELDNPIIRKTKDYLFSYFINNSFSNNINILQKTIRWVLNKFLNRSVKTTKYWFSPIVTKLFKIYPYFALAYAFERVVTENIECHNIWNNTRKISAFASHKIQFLGFFSPVNEMIKHEIDHKTIPIYKLTWKYDINKYSPGTLIHYLLEDIDI